MQKEFPQSSFPDYLQFLSKPVEKDLLVSSCPFQHGEMIAVLNGAPAILQKDLINTINYLHFQNEPLWILLRDRQYHEDILVQAYPEPCRHASVACRWAHFLSEDRLHLYDFIHLVIKRDDHLIIVPAQVRAFGTREIALELPEAGYTVNRRVAPRMPGTDVVIELMQNGFTATGKLVDFSSRAFRVGVYNGASASLRWLNKDVPVNARLVRNGRILFSGNCRQLRENNNGNGAELILIPIEDEIHRFRTKLIRNPRQQISPPLYAVFEHPFSRLKVRRHIYDISTSGFSLDEQPWEELLIPGMIIPELTVIYADVARIHCTAQVIYRRREGEHIRSGIAILDMDLTNYSRLTNILSHTLTPHGTIADDADVDNLWKLFFETGFIYPEKYHSIQASRQDFKNTYRKLYEGNPEIARYFIYQQQGEIYSHISMLRTYERTWMVHHHAAKALDHQYTGLIVLKQLIFYLNDMYRLPSARMDYVMCYFQPENKFADRIYGGFARAMGNPRGCSLDLFASLSYTLKPEDDAASFPAGWSLESWTARHTWEFDRYYRHCSGGLLLDALNLTKPGTGRHGLEQIYDRLGFKRRWNNYALMFRNRLAAVLIVEESTAGINLSELLNGIKIFIVEDEGLSWEILTKAINRLTGVYNSERIPLLIYPDQAFVRMNIPFKKHYCLWIMDVRWGNEYLEYVEKKFRIKLR